MNNKKIFNEKINPLSSILINYYGDQYKDKINGNFSNLTYNFDDIFTTTNDVISNSNNVIMGLIEGYKDIKNKELYQKIYKKHIDEALRNINIVLNIDLSSRYQNFVDEHFSLNKMGFILNDPNKLSLFAKENNLDTDTIDLIVNIIFTQKLSFMRELLRIDYFKDLYKRLGCSFELYSVMAETIFEGDPFVIRFNNQQKHHSGNYLYFPYINLLNGKTNVDIMLLHELIHLAESDNKTNNIGLYHDNCNSFINEVRTDLLAMKINNSLHNRIFENRNDIDYTSFYLKVAKPYLDFFNKYEKVLSDIAISTDYDRLTFIFSKVWNDFSKRMDDLFNTTYKEALLREDGINKIYVKYDRYRIPNLINEMESEASTKVLIK